MIYEVLSWNSNPWSHDKQYQILHMWGGYKINWVDNMIFMSKSLDLHDKSFKSIPPTDYK